MRVQIFDPEMCCVSGVCGTAPDPTLIAVNGMVERLKADGVGVARYQLSRQPQAFVSTTIVHRALLERGVAALPMVLVNDELIATGAYPAYEAIMARQVTATATVAAPATGASTCECGEGQCR